MPIEKTWFEGSYGYRRNQLGEVTRFPLKVGPPLYTKKDLKVYCSQGHLERVDGMERLGMLAHSLAKRGKGYGWCVECGKFRLFTV